MARLRKGRFANDEILDYLQNKDNKALVFTNHHLIYISIKRQEVRWSFSLDNLSSVSTSGKTKTAMQGLCKASFSTSMLDSLC